MKIYRKLIENLMLPNLRKPFPLHKITSYGFVLTFIFGHFLLSTGCIKQTAGALGSLVQDGFLLKEIEIEEARFEPVGLSLPMTRSRNYWLKSGESIAPKWNTFELHWQKENEMCTFTSNSSTNDCQICNYCTLNPSNGGSSCTGLLVFAGLLQVVYDSNFTPTENPEVILDYFSSEVPATCQSNPLSGTPPTFKPENSGLYRFNQTDPALFYRSDTNAEIGIHVVEQGQSMSQTTAYQLTYRNVDNRNYWTWATEGDSVWSPGGLIWTENFSPNLRVRDVRIYRGLCADGSMEGKQCTVPSERVPVKPSRLLFLPNFRTTVSGYQGEAAHRCYGDATANNDNSISLLNCRETNGATLMSRKDVTPTYEVDPARPNEKMTWFIEFNTNEGGDADLTIPGNQAMPTDAQLIIEFTIEAN